MVIVPGTFWRSLGISLRGFFRGLLCGARWVLGSRSVSSTFVGSIRSAMTPWTASPTRVPRRGLSSSTMLTEPETQGIHHRNVPNQAIILNNSPLGRRSSNRSSMVWGSSIWPRMSRTRGWRASIPWIRACPLLTRGWRPTSRIFRVSLF